MTLLDRNAHSGCGVSCFWKKEHIVSAGLKPGDKGGDAVTPTPTPISKRERCWPDLIER